MASYQKRGKTWRVFVRRKGITKSGTFATKAQAEAWAARAEVEIAEGRAGILPTIPFSKLLERYRDFVSVTKRGERWERLRIGLVLRDELAKVSVRDLNATHVADWRDRRLKEVSGASVRREWTLLSHACTTAVKEWRWLKVNPFKEVRRPPPAEHRDTIYTDDQIERLRFALGEDPATATGRTCLAFLFAIETAMRAGEICGLTWGRVNLETRVASTFGKTQAARRDVPLSGEAVRLLGILRPGILPAAEASVFNLNTQQIDALFRKGKERALIKGMTFHDSRHSAITRLAKKLDVLALARMVGHRDLRMLMVYYNESAADLAKKL